MPVKGTPKFDAVALMEIDAIKFTSEDKALVAHGAFIDSKRGATYGRTTCRRWSPRTLEKLEELRQSMEQDMAELVFELEPHDASTAPILLSDSNTGIGEHAREADQV